MIQANAADSRFGNNLTTLKHYLAHVFYPSIFPAGPIDDTFQVLSPIDRTISLHREFVVFCGENQTLWWNEYVQELISFFGECGDSEIIVQETLREPAVMNHCRPYCFVG